jgi:hypothetical protein
MNSNRFLVFLLYPFLGFINSIRFYRQTNAKTIFILFVGFYGYMITTPTTTDMDLKRRKEYFESYSKNEFTFSVKEFITEINDDDSYFSDPFESFIMYTVSRFSTNARFLFFVYGILFALFFANNFWYILNKYNIILNKYNKIFFYSFILSIPFWSIGVFRFFFASQIFLFGLIRYIDQRKYIYLIFALLSLLVHFSFIYSVFILGIYILFNNKINLSFGFLLVSFFLSNLNISNISERFNFLPKAYQNKVQAYSQEDYVADVMQTKMLSSNRWYLNAKNKSLQFAFLLLFLFIFLKRKFVLENSILSRYVNVAMISFGCCFLVINVPSMDRFFGLAYTLGSIVGLISLNDFHNKLVPRASYYPFLLLVGLYLIVEIRIGFDTIGLFTIFGNLPFLLLADSNIAIIEILKGGL